MAKVEGATPMDMADLLKCAICGKGMMHNGDMTFYEITISQCVVDIPNVQRMHGMELMMGGAVPLARVLSPDNTVAHRLGTPTRLQFCFTCGLTETLPAAILLEKAGG